MQAQLSAGSFPLLSWSVQSSASFHVINKLGSVICLTNKTLIYSLPFFFFKRFSKQTVGDQKIKAIK